MSFPFPPARSSVLTMLSKHGREHLKPIYIAVHEYRVAFALVRQGKAPFVVRGGNQTNLTVIGDDTDRALGPSGFHRKSLRLHLRKVDAVVIVACPPHLSLYAAAACHAAAGRNTVLIEKRWREELAWIEFVQALRPDIYMLVGTTTVGNA